jgi:adenine specific DNA methylase Mod
LLSDPENDESFYDEDIDADGAADLDWDENSEVYLGTDGPLLPEDCEVSRISLRDAVMFANEHGLADRRVVTDEGVEFSGRALEALLEQLA